MKCVKLPIRVLAAISVALAFMAEAVAATLPMDRQFGDWTVSCSAIEQFCGAATNSVEGGAVLTLRRSSAPDSNWEVRLFPSNPKAQEAKAIQIVIGSAHSSLLAGKDWQPGWSPGEIVLTAPEAADTILSGLIRGTTLELAVGGPGTVASDYFPLKGVSASLLWVDEAQGRAGSARRTETPKDLANVAPAIRQAQRRFDAEGGGEGEDGNIGPTSRLDTLPPAVLALRRDDKSCDTLDMQAGEDGNGYGVQWLSADTAMFMLPCLATPREPINRYIVAKAPDFAEARVLDFRVWDESLVPPGPSRSRGRDVPWLMFDPLFNRLVATQTDNQGALVQTWRWDGREAHLIEVKKRQWQEEVEGPWSVLWQAPAGQR